MPRRLLVPRHLGMGVGAISIGAALLQHGPVPSWLWVAMALQIVAWPQLAYAVSSRSSRPREVELRNLQVDAALCAFWLPAMGFNVLPSTTTLAMVSMDAVAVGGRPLLLRALAAEALGVLVSAALLRPSLTLSASLSTIVATMPVLILYPLTVGVVMYRMATRLSERRRELERSREELEAVNARLAELSETDALTGLANRRQLDRRLALEWQRGRRHGWWIAVALLDVDHFKRFNDRHGHLAGDECLRRVAHALRHCAARASDVVVRYGGEEFLLLLPHTDAEQALAVGRHCLRCVDEAAIPHGDSPVSAHVTVSVGLAAVWLGGATALEPEALMAAADRALYRAKNAGRHRVERASSALGNEAADDEVARREA